MLGRAVLVVSPLLMKFMDFKTLELLLAPKNFHSARRHVRFPSAQVRLPVVGNRYVSQSVSEETNDQLV